MHGIRYERIPQGPLLRMIQRRETFVYALITRELALKFGVSVDLMSRKSGGINFGGVDRFIGYMPGDYAVEQRLHRSLDEPGLRIYGTQEYYYPVPGVLPVINEMRDWMGIRPFRRRDLPRPSQCTFHGRVLQRESQDARH